MAKKRKSKRLDQFLHRRKQSKEAELQQKTRQANRLFRIAVGGVLLLALLFLVELPAAANRLGLAIIFVLVTVLGVAVLNRVQPRLFRRVASFNQFILLVTGVVLIAKLMSLLGWSPYLVPLPLLGMVLGIAYTPMVALLLGIGLSFYVSLLLAASQPTVLGVVSTDVVLPTLDLQLAIVLSLGVAASVLGVARIRKQSRPVIVGFWAGLVQAAGIIGFQVLSGRFTPSTWAEPGVLELWRETRSFFSDPGFGFAGGLISGGIVTSLLPVIERFFGVVTERRLLDLADPSNNLLRVLRERAPGTFQHTLGVQQLAREATEAIGGDSLLADVGAYYHDIGKIHKPEYFVENMGEDKTIHDRLRPSMSKLIIISHVKDGVLLARDEKLPKKVIDMIPMHHGTTVVEFFYHKALKECPEDEEPRTEDVEYRYPGPKPTFAEAGILMLADAVEAIAKTIPDPTPHRFRDMVQGVIRKRLFDGQLDECRLTLADLGKIEDSFVRTLSNMYHSRIKYPAGEESESATGGEASDAGGSEPKDRGAAQQGRAEKGTTKKSGGSGSSGESDGEAAADASTTKRLGVS